MLQRFWLIRHALVAATHLPFLYGTNDVPVCEETMEGDAPRYAALASRLPRPARLVCTPLTRTSATAQALFRAGYPSQTPLIDPAFVEQNFGTWQGRPIAQFDADNAANRHPFWPIHAHETPPDGESFEDMITRVGNGLTALIKAQHQQDMILISHGGAIRAACAFALGLTGHQALCLSVENLSLTRLEHNHNGWRMLSINEHIVSLPCTAPAAPSGEALRTATIHA